MFNHVHARYADSPPSEAPQLDDVAFAVQQGDFVAITGGNGSGKSTLTRLINAELRPDRGQVVVNGIDVASRTPVQMAQQVAVVGQHPADMFCAQSVREEIGFGPRALGVDDDEVARRVNEMVMAQQVAVVGQHPADMFCAQSVREEIGFGPRALGVDDDEVARRVNEMVRLFDLYDVEDMPAGALSSGEQRAVALACALVMVREEIGFGPRALGVDDDEVARRVNEMVRLFDLYDVEDMPAGALSSGEQRAVALACALVMHAPVLVLDEPAAGLDHRLKSRLLNTVARMNPARRGPRLRARDACARARARRAGGRTRPPAQIAAAQHRGPHEPGGHHGNHRHRRRRSDPTLLFACGPA